MVSQQRCTPRYADVVNSAGQPCTIMGTYFHEMWYGTYATGGHLNHIHFNVSVTSDNNVTDAQSCEVGVTLVLHKTGSCK